MMNMLAILVSLAMLLTGASAPVAEPVSRTLVVSSLSVQHNDETVELSPYVSLGVATDGAKALFDFFVGNGSDAYLPFQVSVDEDGVLVLNDNADVTLKIDRDQIEGIMGEVSVDEGSQKVFELIGDYVGAYGDLLSIMNDPEEMKAVQAQVDAIYDEMVDRGDSDVGSVEYDDEVFDVNIYEYTLTAAQIGALVDAVYASSEKLANFHDVYFRLLAALPEDSGLNGFDSFEALLANFDSNLTLDVIEAISEDGLNVKDVVLRFAVPEMDAPLEFTVHSVQYDDETTGELVCDVDVNDITVSVYMESEQSDDDLDLSLTLTLNPAGSNPDAEPDAPASAAIERLEEEDTDDDYELDEDEAETIYDVDELNDDDDEDEDDENEDDASGVDAVYFNMDYDRSYDEDTGSAYRTLSYSLDVAEQDLHMELDVEGDEEACEVTGALNIGEEEYGFELTAEVSSDPIDERIDASEAVSLDEFDPAALVSSVSGDAMKLYEDESVQKLIAMIQSAMEAVDTAEPQDDGLEDAEAEEADEAEDEVEEIEVGIDDLMTPNVESIGTPKFNWLPEGYAVQDIQVDDEYMSASCTIVNDKTGDALYVDIAAVLSFAENYDHYVLGEDGSLEPIDGEILNAEVGDSYRLYTVDDGTLSISVFPSGDEVTTEDVARVIAGISFD